MRRARVKGAVLLVLAGGFAEAESLGELARRVRARREALQPSAAARERTCASAPLDRPCLLAAPEIVHPPAALRGSLEGVAVFEDVDERGVPAAVRRTAAEDPRLADAGRANIEARRYGPAMRAGAAVRSILLVRVAFKRRPR